MNLEMIRSAYIRSWLLLDTLSAIPTNFLFLMSPAITNIKFLKVFRFLKIFRLVKMLKVKAWQSLEDSGKIHSSHVRFLKLLFTFLFLLHFLAAGAWSIVESSCQPCPLTRIGLDGFETNCDPGEVMYEKFCPENWRNEAMLNRGAKPGDKWIDSSLTDKYLFAFNWALLAMLGDNAHPSSNGQYAFCIFASSFGLLAFSCIIGSLASVLTSMDALANNKKDQLDAIQSYLRYRRVDPELRMRIHGYYKYLWDSGQSKVHMDMFSELPPVLGMELNVALKEDLLVSSPIFKFCTPETTLKLLNELHSSIVIPNQTIFEQGDPAVRVYFVARGLAHAFICPLAEDGSTLSAGRTKMQSLGKGSSFGEWSLVEMMVHEKKMILLPKQERATIATLARKRIGRRRSTVVAAVHTELEDLDKEAFIRLLEESPELKARVDILVLKRKRKNRLVLEVVANNLKAHDAEKKRIEQRALKKMNSRGWRSSTRLGSNPHLANALEGISRLSAGVRTAGNHLSVGNADQQQKKNHRNTMLGAMEAARTEEAEKAAKALKLLSKRMRKTNAETAIDGEVAQKRAELVMTLRATAMASRTAESNLRSIQKISGVATHRGSANRGFLPTSPA
jgi:CRP-like cAMP-binding protein